MKKGGGGGGKKEKKLSQMPWFGPDLRAKLRAVAELGKAPGTACFNVESTKRLPVIRTGINMPGKAPSIPNSGKIPCDEVSPSTPPLGNMNYHFHGMQMGLLSVWEQPAAELDNKLFHQTHAARLQFGEEKKPPARLGGRQAPNSEGIDNVSETFRGRVRVCVCGWRGRGTRG